MTNKKPKNLFSSPWPDKLRKLKLNEVIYIAGKELKPDQVRSLVSNMNFRLKGDAIYKADIDKKNGDAVVACIFRKRDADLSKKKPYGRIHKKVAAKPAAARVNKTQKKEAVMPKPMDAVAIVECVYVNGGAQVMRAADQTELDALLERCRGNEQVVEIITFQRVGVLRKQVQWQVAGDPA